MLGLELLRTARRRQHDRLRGASRHGAHERRLHLGTARLHTCAALSDGTARCWGQNEKGQIGEPTAGLIVDTPTAVSGLDSVTHVSGGAGFSCARLANGTAKCWGDGEGGRLGNGATTSSPVPVLVTLPVGVASVLGVSIDHEHACALVANGAARCWGATRQDSSRVGRLAPMHRRWWSSTRAGWFVRRRLARLTAASSRLLGLLQCAGANESGQLGDGSTTASATPVTVSSLSGVKAVALGNKSTCALLANGTVRCWGDNSGTRLGIAGDSKLPQVVTGLAKVRTLAVGFEHQCASDSAGDAFCWVQRARAGGRHGSCGCDPDDAQEGRGRGRRGSGRCGWLSQLCAAGRRDDSLLG